MVINNRIIPYIKNSPNQPCRPLPPTIVSTMRNHVEIKKFLVSCSRKKFRIVYEWRKKRRKREKKNNKRKSSSSCCNEGVKEKGRASKRAEKKASRVTGRSN